VIEKIGAGEGNRTLVISLEGTRTPRECNAHSDKSALSGPIERKRQIGAVRTRPVNYRPLPENESPGTVDVSTETPKTLSVSEVGKRYFGLGRGANSPEERARRSEHLAKLKIAGASLEKLVSIDDPRAKSTEAATTTAATSHTTTRRP
jgi:hypothetical protein